MPANIEYARLFQQTFRLYELGDEKAFSIIVFSSDTQLEVSKIACDIYVLPTVPC